MGFLVPLVMYGWIPFVIYLFLRFPSHRAVIISFIVAWLFLPEAKYEFSGIPDYSKMSATGYGILLATTIFDFERFRSFCPSWIDIPMLIWCLCPIASSLTNGLGLYDGFSSALSQTVTWGVPYFLGRIYLNNLIGLRQFAIGIFLGGLVYVPLCLYEIRMSPQLHRIVYGFFPHSFAQTIRYGGYRPQVFMEHGLMVGVWMMTATLIGIWLWQAGIIKQIFGVPIKTLLIILGITFILSKSTGAYLLLALGLTILFTAKYLRTAFPLMLLIVTIVVYLQMGITGNFTQERQAQVVSFVSETINPDRAESLEFRFDNEHLLGEKARQRIVFGWGGWGRNRVYEENWRGELVDISVTDSLWIIAFGTNGIVGVASLFGTFLIPVFSFFWFRYPASTWFNPKVAPAAVLSVVLALYMLDCLLNAMINPIFALTCGGISGLVLKQTKVIQTQDSSSQDFIKDYLSRRLRLKQWQNKTREKLNAVDKSRIKTSKERY